MAVCINDDSMSAEVNSAVVSAAACVGGMWQVTGWPRLLTRDEAITALVLAERLAAGHGDVDLFVMGWRQELAR
jgi:hypothetical protein